MKFIFYSDIENYNNSVGYKLTEKK